MEKVSTLRDSVGCAVMASKFRGIPVGEVNPTLSRQVLTSSKMDPATFRAKPRSHSHTNFNPSDRKESINEQTYSHTRHRR